MYAESDGVLIREQKSSAYMISVDSFEKGCKLIDRIPKCNLMAVHQKCMVDYISNKFELSEKLECVQVVYTDKVKIEVKEELEIRRLEENQIEVILQHYDKLSQNEIEKILKEGNLYGGYNLLRLKYTIKNQWLYKINLDSEYQRIDYIGYFRKDGGFYEILNKLSLFSFLTKMKD